MRMRCTQVSQREAGVLNPATGVHEPMRVKEAELNAVSGVQVTLRLTVPDRPAPDVAAELQLNAEFDLDLKPVTK